jgi:hypothetical protein
MVIAAFRKTVFTAEIRYLNDSWTRSVFQIAIELVPDAWACQRSWAVPLPAAWRHQEKDPSDTQQVKSAKIESANVFAASADTRPMRSDSAPGSGQ